MKKDKKIITKNPDIAERKRAEETLRRLAAVVRASNDAIIVQDIDGRITAWNRGAELMYGYSEAEALGMNIDQLSPPDKVSEQKEFTRRLIAGEAVTSFETQRVTKDGGILDVWLTVTKLVEDPADSIISTGRDITMPIGVALIERNITERKKAEAELQRSEQSFKAISANAHDGIIVVLRNGAYIYANKRASEITGYHTNELLKTGIEGLAHPDESLKLSERRNKILAGENVPNQYGTVIIHKNGTAVPIEITSASTQWYGQNANILVFRDITERKRAEKALSESEEWHRALVEASGLAGIGVVVLQSTEDREATIVFANEQACSMAGYSQEDLLKMSLEDFLPPDIIQQIMLRYRNRQEGKPVPSYYETAIVNSDQVRIPVITSAAALKFHGKPATVVYFRNITELKETEEMLRTSEERFRSLIEKSSDVIIVIGRDATISYTSPSFRAVFRRAPSELFGKSALDFVTEFVHPDDVKAVMQGFEDCLGMPNKEIQAEFRFKLLDGSWLNLEATGKNLLDNPSIKGLVVNIRDITERKRAEQATLQEKQFADTVIDSMPCVFYLIDEKELFVRLNKNMSKVTGYSSEELLRFKATDIIAEEDRELIAGKIGAVFQKGYENVEAHLLTKDMRKIPYYFTGIPTVIGDKTYLVGMGIDVTERKRAEVKIQNQLDELKRWQTAMLGREDRVQELKREVNELCRRMGEAVRYASQKDAPADPGAGFKEHK